MSRGFASNYRVVLLAAVLGLSLCGLGARVVQLHVLDRARLLASVANARRQILVQKARRGEILDARGHLLATSKSEVQLGVDPQVLRPQDEAKWPALAALLEMPLPELKRLFTTKTRVPAATKAAAPAQSGEFKFNFVLATTEPAKAPSEDEEEIDLDGVKRVRWAELRESISETTYEQVLNLGIKGVYGRRHYRRAYPQGTLAAHVVGYVNREETAVAGIERYADFYLRGKDGWCESERDGKSRELPQFRTREVAPVHGYQVVLSIDAKVQHMVEEELAAIAAKFQPKKATIIVSDARTGFILGLGNIPTFDLNNYGQADIAAMRNIAVADVLEPGSTFKIVAISGAIDRGLVTPQTLFDCTLDKIEYRGKVRGLPSEAHHFDHRLSVREIASRSSNKGAAQLAMLLGEETFYGYAKAYGFGDLTGFPVGGEVRGTLAPPEKWSGSDITRIPMGHTVDGTPMQIHYAMATIAAGGVRLRPQIIREIRDAQGETVFRYDGVAVKSVIAVQTARAMADMLKWVVVKGEGTAPEAAIPGFEVAGKTGTTQKLIGGRYSSRNHVASFVGFFPASRPEVVISVIVDDADAHCPGGVAYGNAVAAPSFKRIGEQLAQYLDIKPVSDLSRAPLFAANGGRR